ncbi:uncharacterized protein LOC129411744 [Boleophthalmus pectinirostris]|uniref:uncharacterized protein LOC129411744 n=1 Tax=Boleophthalmus pectinirostris TaxID=150288 RepID=UPI00243229D6|nr:uncharacterized protein LOC129411744 [Boleophthalmus pectinirostris]
MDEELQNIQKSLNFMSDELSKVAEKQEKLLALVTEVAKLKKIIKAKDAIIRGLEHRIEDLEQYTRREDIIVSGLQTTHRSYARATVMSMTTESGEDAPPEEQQTLERQVIQFLESRNIKVAPENITACHTLPKKHKDAKPTIAVRFVNRKHKVELLRQAKLLKGTGVYVNEHLTKKNADIARDARNLRKLKKIQATWTRNGQVKIRLNGTPEESKVVTIRDLKDLDPYK